MSKMHCVTVLFLNALSPMMVVKEKDVVEEQVRSEAELSPAAKKLYEM